MLPNVSYFSHIFFSLNKIIKLILGSFAKQWYCTKVQFLGKYILLGFPQHGQSSMPSGLSCWLSGCPWLLRSPLKFKGKKKNKKKIICTFCKLRKEILLGMICYNDKFIRSCSFYLLQNCSLMALICSNDYRKVIQSCSKGKVTWCFLSLLNALDSSINYRQREKRWGICCGIFWVSWKQEAIRAVLQLHLQ